MRRAVAAAAALLLAAAAFGSPTPAEVRAARDAVLSRPEFQYGGAKAKSIVEEILEALREFVEQYPALAQVLLIVLSVVLVAIVAHIIWTLRSTRETRWTSDPEEAVEAAMRRGDPAPLRRRAVEHAEAGRLVDAVRDLYAALLLTLERRGTLRYAAHKALLDYRIESRRDAEGSAALDLFAATYHPASFGRRPADRRHFDELLMALDSLTEPRP